MTAEQIYLLTGLGVDIDDVMDRFVGNESLYFKCLSKFLEDSNYNRMMEAIDKEDARLAFEASHALKGVVSNLGFSKLFKPIHSLVEVFRVGSMDFDPEDLGKAVDCYFDVVSAVKQLNG